MTTYQRVDETEVYRFAQQAFEAAGAPPQNAAIIADNLVQGELHGLGSHGVSRLLSTYVKRLQEGGINPNPKITIVRQRGSTAVVDGDHGPGSVVGMFAMRLAIDLAREHGSGWVAARNSNHFGAAFLFAREALPLNMIGYSATSAVPTVNAFGGKGKALGTNPLCMAVPGGKRGDVILDMATSAIARGKIQLAAIEGKSIPLGWAVDGEGNPTTDPVAAASGWGLPLGGYKGYGLALMVEVLCSLLSGAAFGAQVGGLFSGMQQSQDMGHFFGALDVSGFVPPDEFRARIDELIGYLKSFPLDAGSEEILVPGEPEARKAAEYRVQGIPLAEDVLANLGQVAQELGIEPLKLR
jgi:LDH2 family malate/lactate/ureidoglycolate dehydrogenase